MIIFKFFDRSHHGRHLQRVQLQQARLVKRIAGERMRYTDRVSKFRILVLRKPFD